MTSANTDFERIGESLEAFAKDMVLLVKAVRSYPPGHEALSDLCGRIAGWSPGDGLAGTPIAVSPEKLTVGGRDFGGGNTNTAELAALLFSCGVGAFSTARGGRAEDVEKFAALLADHDADHDVGFFEKVESSGQTWIALSLDGESARDIWKAQENEKGFAEKLRRTQAAWMLLQSTPPEAKNISSAFKAPELWEVGDSAGAYQLALALLGLGKDFDPALALLSGEEQQQIAKRFAALARKLKTDDLDAILRSAAAGSRLDIGFPGFLLKGLGTVLSANAAVRAIAAEGENSACARAIADWLTLGDPDSALIEINRKLDDHALAPSETAPWRTLERLIKPSTGATETRTGRATSKFRHPPFGSVKNDIDFTGDPESNLDHVFIAMAMSGGGSGKEGWEALFTRIGGYIESRNSARAMSVVTKIDQITPFALDSRPELLAKLVDLMLSSDVKPLPTERVRFNAFVNKHRGKLAEPLVERLGNAERASHRKMIVEALSGLNKDATPMLVSRARRGPWYLTRNLVIVLARRKDLASLPYVVTAVDSQDERVARTALRSIAEFGDKGKESLEKIAADTKRNEVIRKLAASLAQRSGG